LIAEKLPPVLMVDCRATRIPREIRQTGGCLARVIRQRIEGHQVAHSGMMVESHLNEGNQPILLTRRD